MGEIQNTAKSARTPLEELQRLSKLTQDMVRMLGTQQELLSQRGITLNRTAIDGLRGVSTELTGLSAQLDDTQIELLQLRALTRITELINSSLDLDFVLDDVVDTVIELTGAERGYVVLRDMQTGELDFKVARSFHQADLPPNEMVVSRTIVQRVAQQGELIVTNNAQEDARFNTVESIANYVLRSILCVPLKRKNQVTGVIYADNRVLPNLFTEREQKLVMAFANQAAVAIENARLFDNVRANLAESTSIRDFMDNVMTSIASGVITTDSEDRIITINGAAASILAVPREESMGQLLSQVLPALFEGFDKMAAGVRQNDREQVIEVDQILPKRGHVNLNIRLSPLKDTSIGTTQGVAIVVDDLTEIKQRQARLNVIRRYLPLVDNIESIDQLELGGVERDISILFCDVRGFTTFSEQLQPEVLMETINKYLTCSSNAITMYNGIIDKYMGDAVVGLWNTQLNPQEDHVLRGVSAALAMVDLVQKLHQEVTPDKRLLYGIGVHTGSAVLGNVGSPSRKEFTAIGDSLQFAKLLQENALGGEVIISQEAYNVIKSKVYAEPVTPRKTKDFPNFTVMYRVTGLV